MIDEKIFIELLEEHCRKTLDGESVLNKAIAIAEKLAYEHEQNMSEVSKQVLLGELQKEADKWSAVYNESKSRGKIDLYVDGMSDGYEGAISIVKEFAPGWIKVTDKLPEDNGEPVLVTAVNGGRYIAVYEPEDKLWWDDEYECQLDVAAWMPMPEEGK